MYRHCPSAKTVSKAREDFPEPETPVMTVTRSWGMAREMFFRLFCLAPSIRSQRGCAIRSVLLRWKVYLSMHHPGNRTALTVVGQFGAGTGASCEPDEARAGRQPEAYVGVR